MFLPDHFLKWALSAILAVNVAEAEREVYLSEEEEDAEESFDKVHEAVVLEKSNNIRKRYGDLNKMSSNNEQSITRSFGQYVFLKVTSIQPQCSSDGTVSEFMPQLEYNNKNGYPLHKYGGGPFCKFRIQRTFVSQGVYILMENNKVMRVGECVNLSSRFNNGYGQISPRNCYENGQRSNCMVNNLILTSVQMGNQIILWFHSTQGDRAIRRAIESALIAQFKPPWNL